MLELRAPENSRTGMEIKPNVRYPDQTEDAIDSPRALWRPRQGVEFKLQTPL